MTVKTGSRIKLSDGRVTGYAEYGDPQGHPVLHFHGLPSSRFEGHRAAVDEIAERRHARVIVVERPGIGLSEFRPYTVASWPDIVNEFAAALHLDRFAVMGLSSGGKYVAACAWKIPHRLTAAGIVSGNCPYDLPGAIETLSKQDKQLYRLADKIPALFRLMLWKIAQDARKNPSSVLSLFTDVSAPDKTVLAQPDIQRLFGEMVVGAFHQGTRGPALESSSVRRLVYISTFEVFQSISGIIRESHPIAHQDGMTPYFKAMIQAYQMAVECAETMGLALTTIHPAAVYGGINTGDGFTTYLENLLNRRFWRVPAIVDGRFPLVHVDSLAAAVVQALDKPGAYIVSDQMTSLYEMALTLRKHTGSYIPPTIPLWLARTNTSLLECFARRLNVQPIMAQVQLEFIAKGSEPQVDRACAELGWQPLCLNQGIQKYLRERDGRLGQVAAQKTNVDC